MDVYKVADITEEAVYDTTKYTDFADLGLEKVSSTTTAEEWAQMAEKVMETVEDKGIAPTADVKVTKPAGCSGIYRCDQQSGDGYVSGTGRNRADSEYTYDFTPVRYLFRITIIPKRTRMTPGYTM